VAEVLRVQVQARVPLLHLPAGADAAAELHLVGAATRRVTLHQVEHAELHGAEDALVVRHHVVLRAEKYGDRVDVVVDRADGLVELEVETDTRRRAQRLDDWVLTGQQHAAADAVDVGVVPDRKAEGAINAEEELLPVSARHRGRPTRAVRTRRNGNTENESRHNHRQLLHFHISWSETRRTVRPCDRSVGCRESTDT